MDLTEGVLHSPSSIHRSISAPKLSLAQQSHGVEAISKGAMNTGTLLPQENDTTIILPANESENHAKRADVNNLPDRGTVSLAASKPSLHLHSGFAIDGQDAESIYSYLTDEKAISRPVVSKNSGIRRISSGSVLPTNPTSSSKNLNPWSFSNDNDNSPFSSWYGSPLTLSRVNSLPTGPFSDQGVGLTIPQKRMEKASLSARNLLANSSSTLSSKTFNSRISQDSLKNSISSFNPKAASFQVSKPFSERTSDSRYATVDKRLNSSVKAQASSSWVTKSDEMELFLWNSYINEEVDSMILKLQPSAQSESDRSFVVKYVENIIRKNLGAKLFPHGSFASKTYLPDSDLNISAFFTHNHQRTWIQRVIKSLLCEDSSGSNLFIPQKHSNGFSSGADAASVASPIVKDASFQKSFFSGQVINASIGGYRVEICANQTNTLSSVALTEEVDILVGRDHLFKRTVILCKAWATYEAQILGYEDGMLNGYTIFSMLLFIFNAFYREIETPLQGLWKLLEYVSLFEWERAAFSLYGPVDLSSIPALKKVTDSPSSWPKGVDPLLSPSMISKYSLADTRISFDASISSSNNFEDEKKKQSSDYENDFGFRIRYLNIIDPRNPGNNLGAGFSKQSAGVVRQAFANCTNTFKQSISSWLSHRHHRQVVLEVFKNTFRRIELDFPTINRADGSSKFQENSSKLLDGNLPVVLQQIVSAAEFDIPDITEEDLVDLMKRILKENQGSATVGKLGSLMHSATNNHSLPAMLKAKYGGLKKLLRRHPDVFYFANDHPHNPRIYVIGSEFSSHKTGIENLSLVSNPNSGDFIPLSYSSPNIFQQFSCREDRVPTSIASADFEGKFHVLENSSKDPINSTHVPPTSSPQDPKSSFVPRSLSPDLSRVENSAVNNSISMRESGIQTRKIESNVSEDQEKLFEPPSFKCPLTHRLMIDPVVALDGNSYERSAIEQWRKDSGNVSPLSGDLVDLSVLAPNNALRVLIEDFQSGLFIILSKSKSSIT